jgi:DNA ligase-1
MNIVITTTPPLYKRDSKGGIRMWCGEVSESNGNYYWRTITGLLDGKQIESGWKIVEQKNIGKANETSLQSQAEAEMNASFNNKLDRGYFRSKSDIDSFDKIKPMLAAKYEDAKFDWGTTQYFSQPKLDGIRCIARANGLWSRSGKEILGVPHIADSLKPYFDENPYAILDGELYNHDLKHDFNKITSLVRKTKPTSSDITLSEKLVEYHVYDLISSPTMLFNDRTTVLQSLSDYKSIKTVPTHTVDGVDHLDKLYGQYTVDGYEGQMVRTNDPYQQNKRSKSLLKRKEFVTEEFKVVSVEEGKGSWAGYIKRFVLEKDGVLFGSGLRGNQELLKDMFESETKPDWATIRYFHLTPDGIPRFPVAIDWGFGERDD